GSSPVPGPDGAVVYTTTGCYTANLKQLSGAGARRLPAHHGPYYLSLPGGPKGTVRVHLAGDNRPFVAVDGIEGADGRDTSGLPVDKRVHLIPDARVLVTISASRDRLTLRRLDVARALERSGVEHLVVVSRPPEAAKRGGNYAGRLVVRSSTGGIQCK